MHKLPKVSIVILNWNRREILLECIQSVEKVRYQLHHIVVVDNNSTDGSVEAIKKEYPDVVLVENARNYGAPEGRNFGVKEALRLGAEYIFTLDNDLISDPDAIQGFLDVFIQYPDVGVAGAKIYDYIEKDLILSAGSKVDYTQNIVRQYGRGVRDRGQFNQVRVVDWVGTGAMMTKREVYEKIGLFDEKFIGYGYEDVDFSIRARKNGYKVVFCPYAKAWHRPHSGVGRYTFRKKYLEARNAIIFMKKHAKLRNWFKYLIYASLGLIYAFFREGLRGNIGGVFGKMKGLYDGFRGVENIALKLMNPIDSK